jgi:hypothetical protein
VQLVGFVIAFVIVAAVTWTVIHRRTLRAHVGISRSEFVETYERQNISSDISGATYDLFQRLASVAGFEPHPGDTFADTYAIDDEDLVEEFEQILKALGCDEMPQTEGPYGVAWPGPFGSVDEAVRWLDLVIKTSEHGGPREALLTSKPLGLTKKSTIWIRRMNVRLSGN